jgi:SAM-dependent methyltransferase
LEVPLDDDNARDGATGAYYDRLSRWTAWAHAIGYGGGRRALTVHRALADPGAGGRCTVTRVHDLLLAALPGPPSGRVLDAGCGLGGTLLTLAAHGTAQLTGLTLSARQAAIGRAAVARAGLAQRIDIRMQSYDDPPAGPFDGIVAIESLAHSPHPERSLTALCARLAPQGWIAIFDDMPKATARGNSDLARFQAGWRAPVLLGAAELVAALRDRGLAIVADHNLTNGVRPRSPARLAALERLNRVLRRVAPGDAARTMLDSYAGGLALERLYRQGLMTYRLVLARKPVVERHTAAFV